MYVLLLKSAGEYNTNPSEDPYVQTLSKGGFHVELLETLNFTYHTDAFTNLNNWRGNYSCIVFTSPRAVNAFTKAGLTGQKGDLCFVVGPSTELQARKAGFSPEGASTGDAVALAEFILSTYSSKLQKPVLFVAGLVHGDVLPNELQKNNIKVNTVTAYSAGENLHLKEKLRLNLCEGNPIPDYLVFFSPSGVSFTENILHCELKPHRPKIKIIAMGRSTASRLEELGIQVAAIPSSPKPESLLSTLKSLTV